MYFRGYTILGLNGFNNLGRPNLGGGVNLNIIPSNGNVGSANLGSRFCHKKEYFCITIAFFMEILGLWTVWQL